MNDLYLDLLKKSLIGSLCEHTALSVNPLTGQQNDWNTCGQTMIGMRRMDNLQNGIASVLDDGVEGDFIECGVWRGGACIFMRGMLESYPDKERRVWVADSFQGLPPPNAEKYPADARSRLYEIKELAVSLEEVRANFEKYGLLDDRVKFIEGWFSDTLPLAVGVERLAILRLDGDLYESTIIALENLYPKLSPGGYCIIDDYGAIWGARKATDDYRALLSERESGELRQVDPTDYREGVYWRKG